MKLSSVDYEVLQRAADVADAQKEFLERSKRSSARRRLIPAGYGAVLAALVAMALVSLLALTSMA